MHHQSARPKGERYERAEEAPEREPMRGAPGKGIRRNPSSDQKRVRRRLTKRAAEETGEGETVSKRSDLMAAIRQAKTGKEQRAAVLALAAHDENRTAQHTAARELDWESSAQAGAARHVAWATQPASHVLGGSSAGLSWLDEMDTRPGGDYRQAALAEAATWFAKTSEAVKADAEEYLAQAKHASWKVASKMGTAAQETHAEMLSYLAFLNREVLAGSGLDQIDQLLDANNQPKKTPLPTETLETFYDDVIAPVNQGVSGTETSERAPIWQAIDSSTSGQGQAENPSHHPHGPELTSPYSNPDLAKAPAINQPQLATASIASAVTDLAAMQHQAAAVAQQAEADYQRALAAVQAASQLPQVQQLVDVHDQPAPTQLNTEVAFPWTVEEAEQARAQGQTGAPQTESVNPTPRQASRPSDRFIRQATRADGDFVKGYNYAASWAPGAPLVALGSKTFEQGVYAAMADGNRFSEDFVQAHLASAETYPQLGQRMALHAEYEQKLAEHGLLAQAAGLYPDTQDTQTAQVNSPFHVENTRPEQAGLSNPAAPGGPAPYNGAPPYGAPVVNPNTMGTPYAPQVGVNPGQNPYFAPGQHADMAFNSAPAQPAQQNNAGDFVPKESALSAQTADFRKRVQSNVLANRRKASN